LTYFFSSSNLIVALVEKLLELYLNVEELRRLVMADEIVSSVTLTEIHRLMEKALTPVSEQVSALYSEMMVFSMVDGGWRTRKKALKQKMKEDWKPRMRALVTRVDQADAWAQLVGIRTARVRWEW
jgi:menaquinone-dependent protoporphyrinogen IX oxidase